MATLGYFDLGIRKGAPGGPAVGPSGTSDTIQTILLYVIVVVGVIAHEVVGAYAAGEALSLSWGLVLVAVILAALVFRQVFGGKLQPEHSVMSRFFIAFESGYFIEALTKQVAEIYDGGGSALLWIGGGLG